MELPSDNSEDLENWSRRAPTRYAEERPLGLVGGKKKRRKMQKRRAPTKAFLLLGGSLGEVCRESTLLIRSSVHAPQDLLVSLIEVVAGIPA